MARKSDSDYIKGWSVADGPAPESPDQIPGNVVTYDELPYRENLREAGLDEDAYHAHLVVAADEDERAAMRYEDMDHNPENWREEDEDGNQRSLASRGASTGVNPNDADAAEQARKDNKSGSSSKSTDSTNDKRSDAVSADNKPTAGATK